jgi:hypothetical protein
MDVVHYFIGTPPASKQLNLDHWHVKLSELNTIKLHSYYTASEICGVWGLAVALALGPIYFKIR